MSNLDRRLLPEDEELNFVNMLLDGNIDQDKVLAARTSRLDELYGPFQERAKAELAFMNTHRGYFFLDYCGILIRRAFPTSHAARVWAMANYKNDKRWFIIDPNSA